MYFHIGHIKRISFHGTKREKGGKAEKTINDERNRKTEDTVQTPCALASVPMTYLLIHFNMYLELIFVPADEGEGIQDVLGHLFYVSHALTCRISRK